VQVLQFLRLRLHFTRIGQHLVKLLPYRQHQVRPQANILLAGGQHHLAAQKLEMPEHLGHLIQHEHFMPNGHGILIQFLTMVMDTQVAHYQVIKLKHTELT
jgi:hypothetical protein